MECKHCENELKPGEYAWMDEEMTCWKCPKCEIMNNIKKQTACSPSALNDGLVALIKKWRNLSEHWEELNAKETNKLRKMEWDGFSATFDCCADQLEELIEESKIMDKAKGAAQPSPLRN